MLLLAALALICGTVLLIGHRTEQALSAKWTEDRLALSRTREARHAIDARRVSVEEREVALRELLAQRPELGEPMPSDLDERIRAWDDEFAQEQERSNITALYALYRDWAVVRSKLAPLVPVFTDSIVAPRDGMVQ